MSRGDIHPRPRHYTIDAGSIDYEEPEDRQGPARWVGRVTLAWRGDDGSSMYAVSTSYGANPDVAASRAIRSAIAKARSTGRQ